MRIVIGNALLCCLVLATAIAPSPGTAQTPKYLQVGEIGVAAGTWLGVMTKSGVNTTIYPAPAGFRHNSVLWDSQNPDSFLMAYNRSSSSTGGYVMRATFVGTSQVVTSMAVAPGSFEGPAQLSWDQNQRDLIIVGRYGGIYRANATSGQVTTISTGGNWGTNVSCGTVDPQTGDIYVGTASGDIWRIASASSSGVLYRSGLLGNLQKLLVDSGSTPHYLYVCTDRAFARIDLGASTPPEYHFGPAGWPQLTGVTSASFDEQANIVLSTAGDSVYRLANPATIPPGGVLPVLLGSFSVSSSNFYLYDVAVVGGTTAPFELDVRAVTGYGARVEVKNPPKPLGTGFVLISRSTFLPADTGPWLGLMPDLFTLTILTIPPSPGGFPAFNGTPPPVLSLPPNTMRPFATETWDFVAVAFSPTGQFLGRSNLTRVTWQ